MILVYSDTHCKHLCASPIIPYKKYILIHHCKVLLWSAIGLYKGVSFALVICIHNLFLSMHEPNLKIMAVKWLILYFSVLLIVFLKSDKMLLKCSWIVLEFFEKIEWPSCTVYANIVICGIWPNEVILFFVFTWWEKNECETGLLYFINFK